jgi:hypothetical protein
VKEGQTTGTFNSLVFHTNSALDFGFAGIFDTISGLSMAMSVGVAIFYPYTSKLLLVCTSQYVIGRIYK